MTDKPKLTIVDSNVVDLQAVKDEREGTPEGIMESIEALYEKAKAGKLKELVLYTEWDPSPEEEKTGRTGAMSIWNRSHNVRAVVGTIAMLKGVAMEALMSSFYMTDDDDDYDDDGA